MERSSLVNVVEATDILNCPTFRMALDVANSCSINFTDCFADIGLLSDSASSGLKQLLEVIRYNCASNSL